MGAGIYRETIEIQTPSDAKNEYGEIVKDVWATFLTTRASFEPLTGRELFTAEQSSSQVDVRFRIRYRTGIQPNYRVLYRGAPYHILYEPIDVEGRHKELLLYCKKVG